MNPDIESIDLGALTADLRRAFGGSAPEGYILGRTALRDAVAAQVGCSDVMAEDIVETLISRGFLRFDGDPTSIVGESARWVIAEGSAGA